MIRRSAVSAVAAGLLLLMIPSPSTGQVNSPPTNPSTPPRDTRPSQNATAIIRGRILAGDTGRPLRRARITESSPELGRDNRKTSTNGDGRYEVKDLPDGRYTDTVTLAIAE